MNAFDMDGRLNRHDMTDEPSTRDAQAQDGRGDGAAPGERLAWDAHAPDVHAPAGPASDVQLFEAHRGLLLSIAYRMLGSATEAEDVVQDAYLRFASAPRQELRSARAWLGTIVTRLCLDRLKAARTTREHYVGPWLPEPVLDADREPSLARAVERRESVTLAFLVLLESLTPQERAVFLLREVFDYEYREIGDMLDLSAANCRQIFHRAKQRLTDQRPRFRPSPLRHRELVESFMEAVGRGDLMGLRALLTDEAVLRSDGGGKVAAAINPLHGPDVIARFLTGITRRRHAAATSGLSTDQWSMTIATVNGEAAILLWEADRLDSVFSLATSPTGIDAIAIVRNPDKLARIARELAQP